MHPSRKIVFKRRTPHGVAPAEKLETLEDVQVQSLLDSQLNTRISLEGQLDNRKSFSTGCMLQDASVFNSGTKSLKEFNSFTEQQEKVVCLREKGLTDSEIQLKRKIDDGIIKEDELGILEKRKYLDVKTKVLTRERLLAEPDRFSNSVALSRQEYEANAAAFHSSSASTQKKVNPFVERKTNYLPENHPLIETLREHQEKEKQSKLQLKPVTVTEDTETDFKIQQHGKTVVSIASDNDDDEETKFIGPLQRPTNERVTPIPEELIFKNRLELGEILAMERFKSYKAGAPSKVLYIKNLHRHVTTDELGCLFSRFCTKDSSEVTYHLLQKGHMRGQAFVSFKDEETAIRALNLCNGYKLHGQPMIIQYGKSKT